MVNFWDHVRRYYSVYGLKASLQLALQTIIGVKKDEIDTLYYLLNEYVDITKLPPTRDANLRNLQLCELELLRTFDILAQKENIPYWLDGGTMLGAIRHKGFIPWDDDVDICMLRENFDNLEKTIGGKLKLYDIHLIELGVGRMKQIVFQKEKTGIHIDIFPVDKCISDKNADEQYYDFVKKIRNVYNYYKRNEKVMTNDSLAEYKTKIIPDVKNGQNVVLYHGPEFLRRNCLVSNESDYFPLKRAKFEQYEFNIPSVPSRFLTQFYGLQYMQFPHGGIKFHSDDGLRISDRGKINGINMYDVKYYLQHVADELAESMV